MHLGIWWRVPYTFFEHVLQAEPQNHAQRFVLEIWDIKGRIQFRGEGNLPYPAFPKNGRIALKFDVQIQLDVSVTEASWYLFWTAKYVDIVLDDEDVMCPERHSSWRHSATFPAQTS